jgi:hypothetical protein
MKDDLAARRAKAEARHIEMVRQAMVAYFRQGCGKTKIHKLTPEPVQEKRANACRGSLTIAKGMHKARGNPHPSSMRPLLRNSVDRKSMESQLRARTSLSPQQGEAFMQYQLGPATVPETGVGAFEQKSRNRRGVQ